MIFYTAGPWADREVVKGIRDKMEAAGLTVKAKWLDVVPPPADTEGYQAYMKEQAMVDLKGVIAADVLIYVNTGTLSEGKATELGVAMAMLKPIIIIGDRSNNIFLHLNIPCYATIEEAIDFMQSV